MRDVESDLVMGVITSARYHGDRAAQFRRHAEHARFPETREMYLRLARGEDAMAEMAERRHRSEMVASERGIQPIAQDPKKPNGEG